jgi:hypothetical protein
MLCDLLIFVMFIYFLKWLQLFNNTRHLLFWNIFRSKGLFRLGNISFLSEKNSSNSNYTMHNIQLSPTLLALAPWMSCSPSCFLSQGLRNYNISWVGVGSAIAILLSGMHADPFRVENTAQGLSCQLKFVHGWCKRSWTKQSYY